MKHMPQELYASYPEYPPLAAIVQRGHSLVSEVKPT
jgi:hypothetical protein